MLIIVDYSFQNHLLKYFVRKNHQSVKQFGSISGPKTFVGPGLDPIGLQMLSIDNAYTYFPTYPVINVKTFLPVIVMVNLRIHSFCKKQLKRNIKISAISAVT